jgi:hypothetical protein
MRIPKFFAAVVTGIALNACNGNEDGILQRTIQADTIRLQQYGGMILDRKVYSISNDGVREDTSFRTADTTTYRFDVALPDAKYEKVKHLLQEIPEPLLQEQTILLGSPKFESDGTATYVIIFREGRKHTYLIADDVSTLPEYLKPFAQKVHQAIADLK